MTRLGRLYYLLRYHKPSQFAWRAYRIAQNRWPESLRPAHRPQLRQCELTTAGAELLRRLAGRRLGQREFSANSPTSERMELSASSATGGSTGSSASSTTAGPTAKSLWPARQDLAVLQAMTRGEFRFLNQVRDLRLQDSSQGGLRINWHPDAPRLWRFHLHYHESLLELASRVSPDAAWAIVASWLDDPANETPHADPDAWHPFCISQRLPIWLMLAACWPPPAALHQRVFHSIAQQIDWLWQHLEWDLGGNHLLENLRALAIADAVLEGDSRIDRRKLNGWIDRELEIQTLPSGEHFERTPTYHALMLLTTVEIADAREVTGHCSATHATARRMADFVRGIIHPDGQIPLFGDSVFGETPSPRVLCDQILRDEISATSSSGWNAKEFSGDYWTWRSRDQQDFLIVDVGAVACDHLPAHAHADLLGIEASVAGRRFLVDTGTYDYEDSVERQLCRSTAAHNTVMIDGVDQCDVWSRFRMGRRGHLLWKSAGHSDHASWCVAAHDAYRHLGVAQAVRAVVVIPSNSRPAKWLVVDWFVGKGSHRLSSPLHIGPEFGAEELSSPANEADGSGDSISSRVLALKEPASEPNDGVNSRRRVTLVGCDSFRVEDGLYCPNFGIAVPNQTLITETVRHSCQPIAWLIGPVGDATCAQVTVKANQLVVDWAAENMSSTQSPRTAIPFDQRPSSRPNHDLNS